MSLLSISGCTDVGQRRTDNQDTFICTTLWRETNVLLAAIDGVGGYAGGEKAAAIALESITRYMAAPNGKPLAMLREAVVFANNQIDEQRHINDKLSQMCCVLTTAIADADAEKLYFVHVGDTRMYRYRQGNLEKLTSDHSMVGMREDAGQLSETEAMQHPRRNEIMREVGSASHRVDDPNFLESGEADFNPGDQLMLCSDGLTDMITRDQIIETLQQDISLEDQTTQLIRLANEAGGNDNITVVLAKFTGQTSSIATKDPELPTDARRNQTDEVTILPVEKDQLLPLPVPKQKLSRPVKLGLLGVGIVLLMISLLWLYSTDKGDEAGQKRNTAISDNQKPTIAKPLSSSLSSKMTKTRLDSLIEMAHRHPTYQLTLAGKDTLIRLTKSIELTDSLLIVFSQSKSSTLVIPADSTSSFPAFRLNTRKSVRLENITVRGFKTLIQANNPTKLQLRNIRLLDGNRPIEILLPSSSPLNTDLVLSNPR